MVKPTSSKQSSKKVSIDEPRSSRSKTVIQEQVSRRMSPRKKVPQDDPLTVVPQTKGKRKMANVKPEGRPKKKTQRAVTEGDSARAWVGSPSEPKNRPENLATKLSKVYKISLRNTWTQLKVTYPKLTSRQKELLAESPFNNLVNAFVNDRIGLDSTSKPNKMIFELLCLYSTSTETFNLAGKMLKLKPQDVSLILGMPLSGEVTELFIGKTLKKPQQDFCLKYFGEVPPKVTSIMMANALRMAVDEEDELDAIRLIIMFIAANVLFPSTTGYSIQPHILLYLESMETIQSYNWPVVVHQFMINYMNKHPNDPIKASGCLLLLPVWFCEHTICYEREERHKDEIPRIVRWSLVKITDTFDEKLASLTSEQVTEDFVFPLNEEETKLVQTIRTKYNISDLILEIDQLKLKNDQLEKENEKLKKENEELQAELAEAIEERDDAFKGYSDLLAEGMVPVATYVRSKDGILVPVMEMNSENAPEQQQQQAQEKEGKERKEVKEVKEKGKGEKVKEDKGKGLEDAGKGKEEGKEVAGKGKEKTKGKEVEGKEDKGKGKEVAGKEDKGKAKVSKEEDSESGEDDTDDEEGEEEEAEEDDAEEDEGEEDDDENSEEDDSEGSEEEKEDEASEEEQDEDKETKDEKKEKSKGASKAAKKGKL